MKENIYACIRTNVNFQQGTILDCVAVFDSFVQMAGCDEVNVMTVDNIEDNIEASSNPDSVSNIVPKTGVPDYWSPSTDDRKRIVRVKLPDVNGVSPKDYEVMTIKVKAENFKRVIVRITDSKGKLVFRVSHCSSMV